MKRFLQILLDPRWAYILPAVHLLGCILTAVREFEWLPVIISEFPAGLVLTAIVWRFGHPSFWFGVFGTLWWCFLSRTFFISSQAGIAAILTLSIDARCIPFNMPLTVDGASN